MGYRGKIVEQNRARDLRALGWSYGDICAELGVARSSVSLWCRDVELDEAAWAVRALANRRGAARRRGPNKLARAKQAEIEAMRSLGVEQIGTPSIRDLFIAGALLYAGEGNKRDGAAGLANTDQRMILLFVTWLRRFFEIDEARLRVRLYLHEGLDLERAETFWSELTKIPRCQFRRAYRAPADPSIRASKHPLGCPSVLYSCSRTHRHIMGIVDAVLAVDGWPAA